MVFSLHCYEVCHVALFRGMHQSRIKHLSACETHNVNEFYVHPSSEPERGEAIQKRRVGHG